MKKKYLLLEIDVEGEQQDKFCAYKNSDGQYIVEYFGNIVDFHFHFGPGPDPEKSRVE